MLTPSGETRRRGAPARQLTATELYPFVQTLVEGLLDKEPSSSSGVCIMLNGAGAPRGLLRPGSEARLVG